MTGNQAAWAIASGVMLCVSTMLSVLSYKAPDALQAALLAAATLLLIAGLVFWVVWGTRGMQQPTQRRRY